MQRISNFWNSLLFFRYFWKQNLHRFSLMNNIITIHTQDQYPITATLFEPENANGKLLLVNSATGVKQQTYYAFAQHFADLGFVVITYDYRGVALSKPDQLKGFKASMRTWGNTDYKAVTDFIEEHYPHHRKFLIGHSVGALILGMNKGSAIFEKFCFVATQNTYFGHLSPRIKMLGLLGFGLYQPVLTRVKGYFKTYFVNLGESLPKGVSDDWRTLIMNRKSVNRLLEKTENFSKNLHQEVLYLNMQDDDWITETGMKLLMNETYVNMKPIYRTVHPHESNGEEIGHINFFRAKHSKLWSIVFDWFS